MTYPRLGVSTHAFRSFDASADLDLLAEAGIRLLELSCAQFRQLADPAYRKDLRDKMAGLNMRLNSIHVPFSHTLPGVADLDLSHPDPAVRRRVLEAALACAEAAAELGGRFIILHLSCEPPEQERQARLKLARESLLAMQSRVRRDWGVRIAVENLPRANLGRDSGELTALVEDLGDPIFGICLDVNHANFTEDLLEASRRYAPHVLTTHISDNDGAHERHWMPGRGVIPWREWVDTMLASGYQGPFVYETGQAEGEPNARTVGEIARNMDRLFAGLETYRGRPARGSGPCGQGRDGPATHGQDAHAT